MELTLHGINYERADTVIGSIVVIVGAAALMIAAASAFGGTNLHGQFGDAGQVRGVAPLGGVLIGLDRQPRSRGAG